jgi:hypothetical protein
MGTLWFDIKLQDQNKSAVFMLPGQQACLMFPLTVRHALAGNGAQFPGNEKKAGFNASPFGVRAIWLNRLAASRRKRRVCRTVSRCTLGLTSAKGKKQGARKHPDPSYNGGRSAGTSAFNPYSWRIDPVRPQKHNNMTVP